MFKEVQVLILGEIITNMQFQANEKLKSYKLVAQQPSPPSEAQVIDNSVNSTTIVQSPDPISISIAVLSLIVSIAVAYVSNFRRSNLKLSLGRNIVFFSAPIGVQPGSGNIGGVGFNLPVTFYNWSPQGGTIQRMRLVIGKQNNDDFYDMTWTTFVKIGSKGNFEDENLAQAIPVEGRSSVNKIIRFDWSPELGGSQFDVQVGNYELKIYGWTKNSEKPSLEYNASFTLKDEHYQKFKDSAASNASLSIWIPLDENEKPNQLVSRNTIGRLYSSN